MILYQNHLIILDYEPKTDILSVEWPSLNSYDLFEISRTVDILVDYIRDYDVNNLLIDGSHSKIDPEMDMGAYKEVVTRFATNLQKTRLRKSASIVHEDANRQKQSEQLREEVTSKVDLQIKSKYFTTKKEAVEWLRESY